MWRRMRERLRLRIAEGIRHRVTPLGAMMMTLLLATGILSFSTSQNVFFLLFSLLAASISISSFVNRLMLAGLDIQLTLPEHAAAGEMLDCGLTVRNSKSWLSSFALELAAPSAKRYYLPCIPASGRAELRLACVWTRRGFPDPIPVEISTRFPFGFSTRKVRVGVRVGQALYPSIKEQAGFAEILQQASRRAAGMAGANEREFSHLRGYAPGEPAREIAWRQSARSQSPVVKTHVAEGEAKLGIYLDSGSPDFERLVELSAYLTWEFHYKNTRFVFVTKGQRITVGSRSDAYTVLRLLALARPADGEQIPDDDSFLILSFRPGYLSLPAESASTTSATGTH